MPRFTPRLSIVVGANDSVFTVVDAIDVDDVDAFVVDGVVNANLWMLIIIAYLSPPSPQIIKCPKS
jgi:hypothetical protein